MESRRINEAYESELEAMYSDSDEWLPPVTLDEFIKEIDDLTRGSGV